MSEETLCTLVALGYHILPPEGNHRELKYQDLPPDTYRQSNGYLPQPLDLESVEVEESLLSLVEKLAENCHNVWAAARIKQGWTYGKSTVS